MKAPKVTTALADPLATSLADPLHMSTPLPPPPQIYSQSLMIYIEILVNFSLIFHNKCYQLPRLSDDEIVWIVHQMKARKREDIDKLAEERVAFAVEPHEKEISQLKSTKYFLNICFGCSKEPSQHMFVCSKEPSH